MSTRTMALLVSAVLVAGAFVGLAVVGLLESGKPVTPAVQPQVIRLADLIARGHGGNPNVRVKDFEFLEGYTYYGINGHWADVYLALVLPEDIDGDRGPIGGKIRYLFVSDNVRGEDDLNSVYQLNFADGVVEDGSADWRMNHSLKRGLEKYFPGIDLTQCHVIRERQFRLAAPSAARGPAFVFAVVVGGTVGLVLGVLAAVSWFADRQVVETPRRRGVRP